MAFPEAPGSEPTQLTPPVCVEVGCERPAVTSSIRCRVHLAEAFRREGAELLFDDPELAGMLAAAIQIVRAALVDLPQRFLDDRGPRSSIDMHASIDPEAEWQLAQAALYVLGAHLADTPPFRGTTLSAPATFGSEVLLRLQVGVPAAAVDELRPRLEQALESMVREVLGVAVRATFTAQPADQAG